MINVAKFFIITSPDPIPRAISSLKCFALSVLQAVRIFHSRAFDRTPKKMSRHMLVMLYL